MFNLQVSALILDPVFASIIADAASRFRRVKCDEGKPFCNRCIKIGIVCDGYASTTRAPPTKAGNLILRPKKVAIPRADVVAIALNRGVRSAVAFEGELDGQCFAIYLKKTAREVSGSFPTSLWERLIPQISEVEPFVRHAVIAIGALGKESRHGNRTRRLGSFSQGPDFEFALKHYDKFLRAMREAIATGQHDLRKALIACLLVFCFEGMLGNQAAAAIHAQRGLMLLHQWTKGNNPLGKPYLTQKAWADQLFENDLLEAFNALDSQILIFIDMRSKEVHQEVKISQNRVIASMPQEITSLEQARQYWQMIMNRNYHFCKSIQQTDVEALKVEREEYQHEGPVRMDAAELLGSDARSGSSALYEEQLRYRHDIQRWRLAFGALNQKIWAGNAESAKASANILQVHARCSDVMMAGTFFRSECDYDPFLPSFQEIVHLAVPVLSYIQSTYDGTAPRFNVDVGIVPALFLVASRCRFDEIRQKAISMLFAANYREGIWDALALANIARWLRSVEVEGLSPGAWIPEEKRAVLNALSIDLYQKKGTFGAVQKGRDTPIQNTTTIRW